MSTPAKSKYVSNRGYHHRMEAAARHPRHTADPRTRVSRPSVTVRLRKRCHTLIMGQ